MIYCGIIDVLHVINKHRTLFSQQVWKFVDGLKQLMQGSPMLEQESVRLVIWDLDETFWRGTLSEGGIREYVGDHHDIVIELAKRGIISSICSKNDYATVEKILREHDIWDFFIFPTIDWTPKGPRLKELINDIQLRPETILFIDDNASNRAEAAMHVPGLRTADETIIPTLLNHKLCAGKNDSSLTRLKQYQLLHRRKMAEKKAGSDNITFLRLSNIRVTIEPNIEAHLDRAIELINRTNQLNFTKARLPDDIALAKEELIKIVRLYYNQAGLIKVWDNYGNYGICGIYVISTIYDDLKKLIHFCFSCRILGMGIERWLFQKLEKPQIEIKGDALIDLWDEGEINWINQDLEGSLLFAEGAEDLSLLNQVEIFQSLMPEIRLKGGCELNALSHYLRQETHTLVVQTNHVSSAFFLRQDTTPNMVLSLSQLDEEIEKEIDTLALNQKYFNFSFFAAPQPGTLFVLSAWGDLYMPVYRHNTLDFEISMGLGAGMQDLTQISSLELENYLNQKAFPEEEREQARKVVQYLAANYTNVGSGEITLRRNWKKIVERIPQDCFLAVILPNYRRGDDTVLAAQYHNIVKDVTRDFPHVITLDITCYIHKHGDVQNSLDHLDRMVYFNIYKDIMLNVDILRRTNNMQGKVTSNVPTF